MPASDPPPAAHVRPDARRAPHELDPDLRLVACDAAGRPDDPLDPAPPAVAENLGRAVALHAEAGFRRPWTAYVAAMGVEPMGCAAFAGPPKAGRVELAFFTDPEFEGRGVAAFAAGALVAIAHAADPSVTLTARTLREDCPSTRILTRLGFDLAREVEDEEAGLAWEWELPGAAPPPRHEDDRRDHLRHGEPPREDL
ncbi:MAG: hypothetical protein CML43_08225 [Rhodobacteraceae bacterium]|nr:hypothetical protein [Paracoccaceae bacterium]